MPCSGLVCFSSTFYPHPRDSLTVRKRLWVLVITLLTQLDVVITMWIVLSLILPPNSTIAEFRSVLAMLVSLIIGAIILKPFQKLLLIATEPTRTKCCHLLAYICVAFIALVPILVLIFVILYVPQHVWPLFLSWLAAMPMSWLTAFLLSFVKFHAMNK